MSHTRKQESGHAQFPYSGSLKASAEGQAQHHFANPMGINRMSNLQTVTSGPSHHSSNSSRIRNFVNATHHNPHHHANASSVNGNISLQQHFMNNPEVLGEAANEGQIAAPAKLSVAGNG